MKSFKSKITLVLISIALLMSACTQSFGGHSVTVVAPHNNCNVTACTVQPDAGHVYVDGNEITK